MFTTVTSRITMNWATPMKARVHQEIRSVVPSTSSPTRDETAVTLASWLNRARSSQNGGLSTTLFRREGLLRPRQSSLAVTYGRSVPADTAVGRRDVLDQRSNHGRVDEAGLGQIHDDPRSRIEELPDASGERFGRGHVVLIEQRNDSDTRLVRDLDPAHLHESCPPCSGVRSWTA